MLDALYRADLQATMVDKVALFLAEIKVSANIITASAVFMGILSAYLIAAGWPWLALIILWVSGYLDVLDGTLARLGEASPVGAVFDILADRVVESAIIVGLFLVAPHARGGLCLLMLACVLLCVTSFLVVGVFVENDSNKSFHYSPGLIERAEAFIFFSLMILLPRYFGILSLSFSLLVLVTTVIRVLEFRQAYR